MDISYNDEESFEMMLYNLNTWNNNNNLLIRRDKDTRRDLKELLIINKNIQIFII